MRFPTHSLFSFVILFSLSFSAPALATESPPTAQAKAAILRNPLAMTITQILAIPKKDEARRDELVLLPSRKDTFLFEGDAELKFTYHLQDRKTAPLIFVIPGTGGNAQSQGALFLAEKFYELGYSTVTLDNPFSWQFTVAGSTAGLPGYTPRDSADLYRALKAVNRRLIHRKGIAPRSYSLTGYSLGGTQSLFIHKLDEAERVFNFAKILLINPPTDLLYAVTQLDLMFEDGNRLSRGRKLTLFNQVAEAGSQLMGSGASTNAADIHSLQKVFDHLQFNERDMAYLIGGSFRDSLRDVIFTSQQVRDLKVLKSPVSRHRRNQRYDESRSYSFNQYLTQFVFPQVKKSKPEGYTAWDLNDESNMYQFADHIRTRQNIFLIHSEDDFILKAKDLAWLRDTFGPRALIFPFGGHCGAMNFPQFGDALKGIFSRSGGGH